MLVNYVKDMYNCRNTAILHVFRAAGEMFAIHFDRNSTIADHGVSQWCWLKSLESLALFESTFL